MLTVPEENANPNVKMKRDFFRAQALGAHYKWDIKSLLSDLAISKARNNYSKVVDGRAWFSQGEDGTGRKDHKFCFQYFAINTKHGHTINEILLQDAYVCSRVVFGTQESLSRTFEATPPPPRNIISGDDTELRLECLMKLGRVSKSLGSEKKPIWKVEPVSDVQDYERTRLKILQMRRIFTKLIKGDWKDETKNNFLQIYTSLGKEFLLDH
jgi:hypothetical protein